MKDWQWISWLANPAEGDARKGQASAKVRETGGRAGGTFAAARSGTIPASRASHRHLTLPHSNCCAAPRTGIKVGNQDWGINLSELGKARLRIFINLFVGWEVSKMLTTSVAFVSPSYRCLSPGQLSVACYSAPHPPTGWCPPYPRSDLAPPCLALLLTIQR